VSKRLVLLATDRYSINVNDFFMFFRRSDHRIVALVHHEKCPRKSWWINNRFGDPARRGIFDPMPFDKLPLEPWSTAEQMLAAIDRLDFDFVCMGNGSGAEQQRLIEHIGRDRCLFNEYGWLPWSAHFYISRGGCGSASDVTQMTAADLSTQPVRQQELERLRESFDRGCPVRHRDYVYVPLQKDVNDFKFRSTHFASNEQFLDFIHEVVPRRFPVLVKHHPLYEKRYDLRRYGRFHDISDIPHLNKLSLYQHMRAMVCINSTSILEAILFGGKVFAYGKDLFLNKDLVYWNVTEPAEFATCLDSPAGGGCGDQFVSLLIDRQISRRRCVDNHVDYIRSHYWNRQL